MKKKILIIGTGGHANSLADVISMSEKFEGLDIDNVDDFKIAQFLYKHKKSI